MQLEKFRVQNFRSIKDSGWIDADRVTTLVGVNEAGKSNILLALWKLNPAIDGKINLLDDIPRNRYSQWRGLKDKPIFIECDFVIKNQVLMNKVVRLSKCSEESIKTIRITCNFDGEKTVTFPSFTSPDSLPLEGITEVISSSLEEVQDLEEQGKSETGIKDQVIQAYKEAQSFLADISNREVEKSAQLTDEHLKQLHELLDIGYKELKKSVIQPVLVKTLKIVNEMRRDLDIKNPADNEEIKDLILANLPTFVYYSNYGNLDSEIYLPHVIENMARTDLTSQMEAKVRTLRVLFDFVGLDPQEILDLGIEKVNRNQQKQIIPLTTEQIEDENNKVKERDVLLQSASTELTRNFKEWWKQGNYRFSLRADGKHFRIWVSDEKRPEEISLEGRSTGLQWFLSFYLIFLVESREAHHNAILLLDEAGVTLHPLAQKDLAEFFESLSDTNQIVHTTHSPFLVDTDQVDRVKVVYVNEEGYTVASNDLRANSPSSSKDNSVYAVHAALGLSVSDVLLQGCKPIIVEGPSDQFYMNAIKNFLINHQEFYPREELIFLPSGGVKGVKGLSSLVSGKEGELPVVLLDSDKSGQGMKKSLNNELYRGLESRVLELNDFVSLENAEVEDLIPFELMEKFFSKKLFRTTDEEFEEIYDKEKALLPQLEKFAKEQEILLEKGWKVELARHVKNLLLSDKGNRIISVETTQLWRRVFEKLNM